MDGFESLAFFGGDDDDWFDEYRTVSEFNGSHLSLTSSLSVPRSNYREPRKQQMLQQLQQQQQQPVVNETKLLNNSQLFVEIDEHLQKWLARDDFHKIVIVSPFIDSQMIQYLEGLFSAASHKLFFFTRQMQEFGNETAVDILHNCQSDMANRFFVQDLNELGYTRRYFHAKFLAGIRSNNVELLVTSANFTSQHFTKPGSGSGSGNHYDNLDTFTFCTLSKATFLRNYYLRLKDLPGWQHCFRRFLGSGAFDYGLEPIYKFPFI